MSRPFVLALTGSIGMGKSTTAEMFARRGIPVWDADAAVHRLYAPDGSGARALAALVPEAVSGEGVSREVLKRAIASEPQLLKRIEAIVHPLVAEDRAAFLASAAAQGVPIVLLDIPLLFETGGNAMADAVVVASAPADVQRARVLAREGMTPEHLETILARQMPDGEKRLLADFVVPTTSISEAEAAVDRILNEIREGIARNARDCP